MYPDVDLAGYLVWTKEATTDIKNAGIVLAVIAKHNNAVLADVVSARQTIKRPPPYAAEAAIAAMYICPLVSDAIEGVLVDTDGRPTLLELLEQADKVLLDLVDQAC
jgi:hypothetical protein